MKKIILLFVAVTMMCFVFTACGGSGDSGEGGNEPEVEKTYDLTDDTGIINMDLTGSFKKDGGEVSENSTWIDISDNSKVKGWVYITISVKHQNIYENMLKSESESVKRYLYAEDITTDATELFGLKGNKITFVDSSAEDGKLQTTYVLVHGKAGEMGEVIRVTVKYYKEDLKMVDKQLKKIELNWDAYDFDKEKSDESDEEE